MIFNSLVQPSLKIGISDSDEMITSQYAAGDNLMLHENAKDLSAYVFIGCHFVIPLHRTNAAVTVSRSCPGILERSLSEEGSTEVGVTARALFHDSAFLNSPADKPMA